MCEKEWMRGKREFTLKFWHQIIVTIFLFDKVAKITHRLSDCDSGVV